MRLKKLTVVCCTYLFSLSCVIGPKSAALNPTDDVWTMVLARLNEGSTPSMDVQVDLLKQNEQELIDIAARCAGEPLLQTNRCFTSNIQELNQKSLNGFVQSSGHTDTQQIIVAQRIINEIEAHPVTSSGAVYDFEDGNQIGFCFGRALMAHYLLLKSGVKQSDMRKVFAVGDLMFNSQIWKFHVAVMVRDAHDSWMVVDPLQKRPLPLSEWMLAVNAYDIKTPLSRVRFHVTDVRKFLPASGIYEREQFSHPSLSRYFDRLGIALSQVY